jgi:putative ABC transport system permease protein
MRHRMLTALNVLGIALGVTVFMSVQIVNHSALQSFRASVDVVAGRANLVATGDGLKFDEELFFRIAQHPDIEVATPVVEEVALIEGQPGEYLHVLGVDVFTHSPLRTYQIRPPNDRPAQAGLLGFVSDPHVIGVTETLAKRLGWHAHDKIRLRTSQGIQEFRIGYLLKFDEDAAGADEHLAVMDIASAQQAFGLGGKLNRVDAVVRDGVAPASVAQQLRQTAPGNVTIAPPDRRGTQIERMIGAFQLNLTALSLVSLLVGMFLVYNTVMASVVRRRAEIGLLRALGLSQTQVQALFLGEAVLMGLIGLALGISLGFLLAQQLVGIVSRTITSLYILLSIREVLVTPLAVAAAFVLAVATVLAGAWFPSQEAARVAPVEALNVGHLRQKSRLRTRLWLVVGLAFGFVSAGLGWGARVGALPAWCSFGSALFCLLGFAFAVPWTSQFLVTWLRPTALLPKLAAQNFGSSLHRNAVTLASLVTALAMVVGTTIMIFSFRSTVETWMNRSVIADLFVAPAANLIVGPRETLRPEVVEIASSLPEVKAYDLYREMRPTFRGRTIKVAAFRFPVNASYNRLEFLNGSDGSAILRQAAALGHVAISEVFSRRFGLSAGDTIELGTPDGTHVFPIAGVFIDYTTEAGLVIMDIETYRKTWKDSAVNSIALHAHPGVDSDDLQKKLRLLLAPLGEHLIYSNERLRIEVFRIFDQTFAVTYILQSIGIIVSGLGIFLSLLILVSERTREIGILRAIGASQVQVQALVICEAAYLGLLGSIIGLAAGLALAVILSFVINVAFFGWTIRWATPWAFLFAMPLWVLTASIIAAWWPAWQASRINPAEAVKME